MSFEFLAGALSLYVLHLIWLRVQAFWAQKSAFDRLWGFYTTIFSTGGAVATTIALMELGKILYQEAEHHGRQRTGDHRLANLVAEVVRATQAEDERKEE